MDPSVDIDIEMMSSKPVLKYGNDIQQERPSTWERKRTSKDSPRASKRERILKARNYLQKDPPTFCVYLGHDRREICACRSSVEEGDPPTPRASEQLAMDGMEAGEVWKAHKRADPRAFCGYLEDETTVKLDCCSRCEPYHGMCLSCWAALPVEYGATPDFLSQLISPAERD